MKTLLLAFIAGVSLLVLPLSNLYGYIVQEGIPKDLNRDGILESVVFYDGKLIQKILMDADQDGKMESVIFYKNGHRSHAYRDVNLDGQPDAWVSYYFTGSPWKISQDRNSDGAPDYWQYLKDGTVYKWELDRNFDGKVDMQLTYDSPHMAAAMASGREILKQLHDNDYDGFFEEVSVSAESRPVASTRVI